MPKKKGKPWENGGKGNGKKKPTGIPRRPSVIDGTGLNQLSKVLFAPL